MTGVVGEKVDSLHDCLIPFEDALVGLKCVELFPCVVGKVDFEQKGPIGLSS